MSSGPSSSVSNEDVSFNVTNMYPKVPMTVEQDYVDSLFSGEEPEESPRILYQPTREVVEEGNMRLNADLPRSNPESPNPEADHEFSGYSRHSPVNGKGVGNGRNAKTSSNGAGSESEVNHERSETRNSTNGDRDGPDTDQMYPQMNMPMGADGYPMPFPSQYTLYPGLNQQYPGVMPMPYGGPQGHYMPPSYPFHSYPPQMMMMPPGYFDQRGIPQEHERAQPESNSENVSGFPGRRSDALPIGNKRSSWGRKGNTSSGSENHLSTSTEDLLSMAGGTAHLLRDAYRITDSPPTNRKNVKVFNSFDENEGLLQDFGQLRIGGSPTHGHMLQHPMQQHPQLYSSPVSRGGRRHSRGSGGGGVPGRGYSSSADPMSGRGKRNVCKFFASGYCSKGAACNFLHLELPYSSQAKRIPKKQNRIPHHPSKYNNVALEDCVGQIALMCLDQHGCRYLQKELESDDREKIDLIFSEVIPHIGELMSDPFGNYLCQKLIEKAVQDQRTLIVKGCANNLVSISKNMHGTRAVQRLIESLSTSEEFQHIRESLRGSVVGLIEDLNGNHVVQKCLHKMEPVDNQFIYDAVSRHCVQVATHRHGCCVFQRCIDHGTLEQKKQLVEQIKLMGLPLVQDPYGNYVVQYALDLDLFPDLPGSLIETLQYEIYYLARQKFSSNVVEKCLKVGDSRCAIRIMRDLLFEQPDPDSPPHPLPGKVSAQSQLFALLQDQYGNYVVQTCLSEGSRKAPREYLEMATLLRPVVHQLSRNVPYMKRIQNLLNLPTAQVPSAEVNVPSRISPRTPSPRDSPRNPSAATTTASFSAQNSETTILDIVSEHFPSSSSDISPPRSNVDSSTNW